jgi:hypothetical protein
MNGGQDPMQHPSKRMRADEGPAPSPQATSGPPNPYNQQGKGAVPPQQKMGKMQESPDPYRMVRCAVYEVILFEYARKCSHFFSDSNFSQLDNPVIPSSLHLWVLGI